MQAQHHRVKLRHASGATYCQLADSAAHPDPVHLFPGEATAIPMHDEAVADRMRGRACSRTSSVRRILSADFGRKYKRLVRWQMYRYRADLMLDAMNGMCLGAPGREKREKNRATCSKLLLAGEDTKRHRL